MAKEDARDKKKIAIEWGGLKVGPVFLPAGSDPG